MATENGLVLTIEERLDAAAVAQEIARRLHGLTKVPMRRVVLDQVRWLLGEALDGGANG